MGGDDEGKFQWLAVNHLLGTLDPLDQAPGHSVIDLGGGSMQVAYSMPPEGAAMLSADLRRDYVRDVSVPGRGVPISLYQHSYPGFGLMAGRARMMRWQQGAGAS